MRAVARALVAQTKSNVEPIYKKQPKLVVGALCSRRRSHMAGGTKRWRCRGWRSCWRYRHLLAADWYQRVQRCARAVRRRRRGCNATVRYDASTARCLYVDIDAGEDTFRSGRAGETAGREADLVPRVLPAPKLPAKRLAAAIAAFDEEAGRRITSRASRILAMAAPPSALLCS